jgi:hypothetical protein
MPSCEVTSRREFLERIGLAGAAAAVGGVVVAGVPGWSAPTGDDTAILNFLAVVEAAQAELYMQADMSAALSDDVRRYSAVAGEHEQKHLDWIRETVGGRFQEPPTFDFVEVASDEARFLDVAVELEDQAIAANNGVAGNLSSALVVRAAEVVSVEGRHAAWIRDLAGVAPAPSAADPATAASQVTAALRPYAAGGTG